MTGPRAGKLRDWRKGDRPIRKRPPLAPDRSGPSWPRCPRCNAEYHGPPDGSPVPGIMRGMLTCSACGGLWRPR